MWRSFAVVCAPLAIWGCGASARDPNAAKRANTGSDLPLASATPSSGAGPSATPPPACAPGQVRLDPLASRACCWPGQSWDRAQSACTGTPACPDGFIPDGQSCRAISADAVAAARACADYTWSDSPHPGPEHQSKEDACRAISNQLPDAQAYLDFKCARDDKSACNAAAMLRDQVLSWYVEALSLPQCAGNRDCWSFLVGQRGAAIDNARADAADAVRLYDHACTLGRADACMSVARLSGDDEAGKAKAASYYRKACDLGRAGACAFSMNTEMKRMLQDSGFFTRALGAFKTACDAGDASGCNDAGVLLATGRGAPKDLHAAIALLDKGCVLRGANACGNLIYANLRDGAPKDQQPDYARAEPVLRAACDEGNPRACHALGWMLDRGIGVAADHDKARAILKAACDQGACEK